MTVHGHIGGALRRAFGCVMEHIRDPALLVLWVLLPVALAHIVARVDLDLPTYQEEMIMLDDFKRDVSDWILNWVSQYNTNLGQVPCPFAKKALIFDNIDWDFVESESDMIHALWHFKLDKEVSLIGFDPERLSVEFILPLVKRFNDVYSDEDLVILEDHPHDKEILLGECMNQGKWGFLAIQKKSKLNAATKSLMAQGYYDKWPKENWDNVVAWRLDD